MIVARKKTADSPGQILMFADLVPMGDGRFNVVPRKPQPEVSSATAAEMLGVCRSSLSLMVNSPLGQRHLRWRWLTEKKGKRVFEIESVVAYREATRRMVD